MLSENQYKVKTAWGWFTLDERSYQDYLNGKFWISTSPRGEKTQIVTAAAPAVPANVSAEAVRLRELAAREGAYPVLRHVLPGGEVEIPYRARMSQTKTEVMSLSARSSSCLMRAGATTLGGLFDRAVSPLYTGTDFFNRSPLRRRKRSAKRNWRH